MNTSTKMIVVLTLIAVLSGGILAGWDAYTAPKIEQHRLEAIRAAVAEVLPEYDHYEEVQAGEKTFYVGKTAEGGNVGVAFQIAGSGFQGEISMMVGMTPNFTEITGLSILAQVETPGLGTKIVTDPSNKKNPDWFTDQFNGIDPEPGITVVKNQKPSGDSQIQAITGATISSKAVADILNSSIEQAKTLYENEVKQVL